MLPGVFVIQLGNTIITGEPLFCTCYNSIYVYDRNIKVQHLR